MHWRSWVHVGARSELHRPPYRELGAVALGRAQELVPGHVDFRFERIRHQQLAVRDGSTGSAVDVGFAAVDVGFAAVDVGFAALVTRRHPS